MHIFDISNLADPALVGEVELSARPQADSPGCGTHTLTPVPDLAQNRLVIYNATSGGNALLPPQDQACDWVDIVQVPLGNPAAASHVRRELLEGGHAAHDNGAILGDVNLLATASGHMSNVFDIGANAIPGGSLEDPQLLFTIEEPGVDGVVGNWHSAGFTWDGKVIILGWEPGGGAAPFCQANGSTTGLPAGVQADVHKSAFFYDAGTGAARPVDAAAPAVRGGELHHPQLQHRAGEERPLCPGGGTTRRARGSDFTDPANAKTVAWSDPPPLSAGHDAERPSRPRAGAGRGPRTGTTASSTSRRSPRPEPLPALRQRPGWCHQARPPEPPDAGALRRVARAPRSSRPLLVGRPLPRS